MRNNNYQDDSALFKKQDDPRSQRGNPLIKSLMEASVPKNKQNVVLKDLHLHQKADYRQQPYCTVCYRTFTTVFRRHHCRVCANACCSDCSAGKINSEKACDVCYLKHSSYGDLQRKTKLLETMQTLCGYLMYSKQLKTEEFESIKVAVKDKNHQLDSRTKQDEEEQQTSLKQLETQSNALTEKKRNLSNQLNLLIEKNRKLEEEMRLLEHDNE